MFQTALSSDAEKAYAVSNEQRLESVDGEEKCRARMFWKGETWNDEILRYIMMSDKGAAGGVTNAEPRSKSQCRE